MAPNNKIPLRTLLFFSFCSAIWNISPGTAPKKLLGDLRDGNVGAAPQNDYFSCFLISFYCLGAQHTHKYTHTHSLKVGNFHNNAALGVAASAATQRGRHKKKHRPHVRCQHRQRRQQRHQHCLPLILSIFTPTRPASFGLFRLLAATSAPLGNQCCQP